MKRILSIAVLFILIIGTASCVETKGNNQGSDRSLEIDFYQKSGTEINLHIPIGGHSKINIDHIAPYNAQKTTRASKAYMKTPYEELDDWYEYIESNTGVNMKIHYIPALYNTLVYSGDYFIERIASGEMSGLIIVEFGNYNSFAKIKDSGYIVPLDDYLKDNPVYAQWPEEMKAAGRMADRQTWLLPAGYNQQIYGRFYRKQWLDNLGLDVPETLGELHEVARAFTFQDPDKNGSSDEKGIRGMFYDGPGTFGDIFLAHECWLTNEFMTSIAYDYNTGAYEDMALKPQMLDALTMIQGMMSEGLVELSTTFNYLESEKTGMLYGKHDVIDNDEFVFQYSLTPEKEHSAMGVAPERYYALAHTTENPDSVIDGFLGTFYSSAGGMLSGIYGIKGIDFKVNDRTIEVEEGPRVDIIDDLPYLADNDFVKIKTPVYDKSVLGSYSLEKFDSSLLPENNQPEYINAQYELYRNLYAKNILVIDPVIFPHSMSDKFNGIFSKYFMFYATGQYEYMDAEYFLDYYRREMKKFGAQQILDDLNQQAGTTADFRY